MKSIAYGCMMMAIYHPVMLCYLGKPNRHRKGLGMEMTKEMLEARVREAPLSERLDECRKRIGKMCSEGRPPRMCIPVQWDDDDFYISTTLADAQRALDVEREKVRELEQEGLQLFEWRLALHSLTPGGSEFCTPDACESWVRKNRASQHEYIIEQIKQRKELQAQLATLQAQLAQPIRVCQGCGRVSRDGWVTARYECDELHGSLQCPDCQCIDLETNTAKELAALCTQAQAQLRHVEGALQERKEFIADCDTALDRIQAPRTNEGQEELVSTWRRIELIGGLLQQYRVQLEEHVRIQSQLSQLQALVRAYQQAMEDMRDAVLNGRGPLAEMEVDNDVINAVLGIIDDNTPTTLDATTPATTKT